MTSGGRPAVLALLTGSSAIQSGSGAVAAVLATVLLGPSGRGAMVLGLTICGIAVVVAGLGTGSALRNRLPAAHDESARGRLVAAYTWWSAAAVLLGGFGAALACALCAPAIDPVLATPGFLAAVALVTAGQTAAAQQTDAWFAAGLFRAGGGFAAAITVAGLLGLLAAAAVDRTGPALLLGQAVGTALVAALAQWRLARAGLASLRRPREADVRWLLRKGMPVLGTTVGFVVAMRADRFVLGLFAGTAAVGVYSLAATLAEMPRMLPAAVGQLLLRDVAVDRAGATLGATGSIRRALRLSLVLTVPTCLVIGVGGWLTIGPLFGADFTPARGVLLVLLGAEVGLVPYGLAIRGLVGGGWTAAAGAIGVAGAVLGLVGFGLAIPLWTVMGAAGASLVLYIGLSVTSWRVLVRRLARPVVVPAGAVESPVPAVAT